MFPKNTTWPIVPLKSITVKIGSGATPRGGKESYKQSGISLIRSLNVYDFSFDKNDLALIDEQQAEELRNVEVHNNDILLNITGASVARCCIVPSRLLPARVNQHVAIVRCDPSKAESKFILYVINSPYYKHNLLTLAQGGATREALTKQTIEDFGVPFPPLPIQRRIASILSAYDDLIENNTRRIAILEEMARRIYEEWFVKFKFPGHEKVKMVDSELGKIPEGWEVTHLSHLVDPQYGYTESTKDKPIGPKFLRGMDINKQSYIDWSQVPYCPIPDSEFKKYKLGIGDVIVIRMADPGKIGIVEKQVDAVFASYLVRLKIRDKSLTPYYLFYFLTGECYQDYISGASTGTTRKSASAPVITGINLSLPPASLIDNFEKHVIPLRKLINVLIDKNNNLRTTRDFLLPKLISGEIDVSKLPEPEEAAA